MHEVKPYHTSHPHSKLLVFESLLFLAFVVFLFFLLGFVTNANATAVLLAFLPSLLFGVAIIILIQTNHFQPAYNWLVMIAFLVAFGLIFFLVQTPLVQGLDALTVLVMNAILMTVALLIMHTSYAHEKPVHEGNLHERWEEEKKPEKHVHVIERVVEKPTQTHVHVHTPPQEEEVDAVVHSIEDKVKALNFVIGRVYSVYHGGSERLRNKIRVDKAWYADFNTIDAKDSERRRAQAIVLLGKIKDRLELLQKSEEAVFGDDVSKLKNIQHEPSGSDAIIDVLVRNDKDPVRRYYDGALSFCTDAIRKLNAGKNIDSVVPKNESKK